MTDFSDGPSRPSNLDRRNFLELGAGVAGAMALSGVPASASTPNSLRARSGAPPIGPGPDELFAAPPIERVRMGFVGVGLQGGSHVRNFLKIDGVEIKAICDINAQRVAEVQDWVTDAGQPKPTGYFRSERDFERLVQEEELDLVFTATPWRWHVPVCIAAMEAGKHAATEVPAALTIEECWQLVEAAERLQKHCVMMENVNYGRTELMVLNMVRQEMFGELLHAECGYLHDLRAIKFLNANEGLWRREHSKTRNGNLYPTHGLGPVAQYMDINRGDQFDYLISMSSNSRGLQEYAREHFRPGTRQRSEEFALGDINTSLIKTSFGRTIIVSHDTNLPRPYSRRNMIQGTRGLFSGYPNRLHIEGRTQAHSWDDPADYVSEFDHPLWTAEGENARGAGHGGMDYIEDYRLIKCLRDGIPTDMNVYDAAALSVVSPLSEMSVANGGAPISFPDFTRGQWRNYPQLEIVGA